MYTVYCSVRNKYLYLSHQAVYSGYDFVVIIRTIRPGSPVIGALAEQSMPARSYCPPWDCLMLGLTEEILSLFASLFGLKEISVFVRTPHAICLNKKVLQCYGML